MSIQKGKEETTQFLTQSQTRRMLNLEDFKVSQRMLESQSRHTKPGISKAGKSV